MMIPLIERSNITPVAAKHSCEPIISLDRNEAVKRKFKIWRPVESSGSDSAAIARYIILKCDHLCNSLREILNQGYALACGSFPSPSSSFLKPFLGEEGENFYCLLCMYSRLMSLINTSVSPWVPEVIS